MSDPTPVLPGTTPFAGASPFMADAANAVVSGDGTTPNNPMAVTDAASSNPVWFSPSSNTGISPGPGFNLGAVLQQTIATGAREGLNPLNPGSWGGIGRVLTHSALDQLGQINPDLAILTGNGPVRSTIEADIAAGNWGGVAAAAITGAAVPYLADKVIQFFAKRIGQSLGLIPPAPRDPTVGELGAADDVNSAVADRGPVPEHGNIGHKGTMEVRLGPIGGSLTFEIPPAVHSSLPIHGSAPGQITPGAQAGVSFKHMQNYATLLIPGSSPVYQSLGIQGHMIEFVGAFLGFNYKDPLHSNKHESYEPARDASGKVIMETDPNNPNAQRPQPKKGGLNDNFNPNNPDPLYTNSLADQLIWKNKLFKNAPKMGSGGAWSVSKAFEQNVEAGMPQVFEMNTGIAKITYNVIVVSLERLYERDDRVYYKFQGLALDGGEADDAHTRIQAARSNALPLVTRNGQTSKRIGTGVTQQKGTVGPTAVAATGSASSGTTPKPGGASNAPVSTTTSIALAPINDSSLMNLLGAPDVTRGPSDTFVDRALGANPAAVDSSFNPGQVGSTLYGGASSLDQLVATLEAASKQAKASAQAGRTTTFADREQYPLVLQQLTRVNGMLISARGAMDQARLVKINNPDVKNAAYQRLDVWEQRYQAYNSQYQGYYTRIKNATVGIALPRGQAQLK